MTMWVYGAPKTTFILLRSTLEKTQNHRFLIPERNDTQRKYLEWLDLSFSSWTTTSRPSHCVLVSEMVSFSKKVTLKSNFLSINSHGVDENGHFVDFCLIYMFYCLRCNYINLPGFLAWVVIQSDIQHVSFILEKSMGLCNLIFFCGMLNAT